MTARTRSLVESVTDFATSICKRSVKNISSLSQRWARAGEHKSEATQAASAYRLIEQCQRTTSSSDQHVAFAHIVQVSDRTRQLHFALVNRNNIARSAMLHN